jgi:hypothetical protein
MAQMVVRMLVLRAQREVLDMVVKVARSRKSRTAFLLERLATCLRQRGELGCDMPWRDWEVGTWGERSRY